MQWRSSSLDLRILASLDDMRSAEPLWRALEDRSTAELVWFQSFSWCFQWVRHHGSARVTPCVLMLLDEGEAVAILPLMCVSGPFGLTTLKPLGEPHTQYANILTRQGSLSESHKAAMAQGLAQLPKMDVLALGLVPDCSPLAQVLTQAGIRQHMDNQASLLDLGSFATLADYEAKRGKKTMRNLRHSSKHLQALGPLRLEVVHHHQPMFPAMVQRCIAFKKRWLTETGRLSVGLEKFDHSACLAAMGGSDEDSNGPLAFVLYAGDRICAIEIGFLQRGHYYAYIGAFDWSLRHLSPGKLQMHMSIGWLIAQRVRTLDLLGNPAEYKKDFAPRSLGLLSGHQAHTLKGYLYANGWVQFGKPYIKWMLSCLPRSWRGSVQVIRKLEYNFIV